MKRLLLLVPLILWFTACASYDPTTGQVTGAGLAGSLQDMIKQLVTEPLALLRADATARITTIDAEVAAGSLTPISAVQKKQCSQNVINFVDGISAQVGMKIPDGAGAIWLLGLVNDLTAQQKDQLTTQVKLMFDSCKDQFNLKLSL